MKPTEDQPKQPTGYIRPTPPKKPTAPAVRRIVNEKVINKREIWIEKI